jgi:hypothetical protein
VNLAGVAPGMVIAGRYRIDHVVPSVGAQRAYIGTALGTGQYVMLIELGATAAALLGRALLVAHPNLATLVEFMPLARGDSLAVVEYTDGITLKERIETAGALSEEEAVGTALCVANGLGALHQRGAAHGLLRPACVVLSPAIRGGAMLGYAPPIPLPNPFRTPERGLGPPSPADDVWALGALLFTMLAGKPPPAFGVRGPEDVAAAGVRDASLCEIIADCMRPQRAHRVTIVTAVRDALAQWHERRFPAGGAVPPGSSVTSASVAKTAPAAGRSRVRTPVMVGIGVAAVAAAGVAWVVVQRRPPAPAVAAAPASAPSARAPEAPVASAAAAPAESSDSVSADSLLSGDEIKSCVIRQLPDGSVLRPTDFDWLCITRDPRKGVVSMRSALVEAGGHGVLTPAMDLWSRMHWYSMAGFAVIRASCCEQAAPLELPEREGCEPLAPILDELGATVAASQSYQPALDRYTKAIKCHSRKGGARQLGQRGVIGGGEITAFEKLLRSREGR